MAVNTRQKRMSMMGFGQPIPFIPMFQTDGDVDADDRVHQLILYSGEFEDGAPSGNNISLCLTGVGS